MCSADANTMIILTSDNGTHNEGGHDPEDFNSAGPFRGMKRDLYEGGIRTPFVVRWDGVIPAGTTTFHQSAFWDFLPTMADLIGADSPKGINGISYLPTLTGKGEQLKHGQLYFEFHERGGKQALIQAYWKLIILDVNNPEKTSY